MVLAMGGVRQCRGPDAEARHVTDRRGPTDGFGLAQAFRLTVASGTIWVAIFFLSGFMLSYMTVLSWADYSYVMPAGAFGYALLTFLAVIFLHESVSPRRWVASRWICVGVLLVGQTKPRTTAVASEAVA